MSTWVKFNWNGKQFKIKANSTCCSQAVTNPSTNHAQRCLTAVIKREPVFTKLYGCWQQSIIKSLKYVNLFHYATHYPYYCIKLFFKTQISSPLYVYIFESNVHKNFESSTKSLLTVMILNYLSFLTIFLKRRLECKAEKLPHTHARLVNLILMILSQFRTAA